MVVDAEGRSPSVLSRQASQCHSSMNEAEDGRTGLQSEYSAQAEALEEDMPTCRWTVLLQHSGALLQPLRHFHIEAYSLSHRGFG